MRWQTLKEARWIFLVLFVLAAISYFLFEPLAAVWGLLILFTISFFRDPDRTPPAGDEVVVAAADGKVSAIEEIVETDFLKVPMKRVAIFLSVFNVHTNRAPIDGKVTFCHHEPGKFLDARNPECSLKNERMTWAFERGGVTLVVRQITGAIARRIVAWSRVGDVLKKGERFGMIRFGSRTEVYLPLSAEVVVKIGDNVKGGETVIAKLR
jgi:phosphatidylserine decarboxylase